MYHSNYVYKILFRKLITCFYCSELNIRFKDEFYLTVKIIFTNTFISSYKDKIVLMNLPDKRCFLFQAHRQALEQFVNWEREYDKQPS